MVTTTDQIDVEQVRREVEAAVMLYEDALVNNKIEILDALFWNDPRTVRYGATENLYGFASIAAFRKGRSPKNLYRELTRVHITTYGEDCATAWVEFRRPNSDRIGRQSQVWRRFAEGWRIVAAHVSNQV